MDTLGIIDKTKTAFVLIDIQEKFLPIIHTIDAIIDNTNILTTAAKTLNIPLLVTEQYPKGLGKTTERINIFDAKAIEKMSFSCFGADEFVKQIKALNVTDLVLFGIETHVCVLKTALDALKDNYTVHLVVDAIGSRKNQNKNIGIKRMKQSGAFATSTESILFQLIDGAGTDEFKMISKLIK
jgi:nicotinamidase-related amidase